MLVGFGMVVPTASARAARPTLTPAPAPRIWAAAGAVWSVGCWTGVPLSVGDALSQSRASCQSCSNAVCTSAGSGAPSGMHGPNVHRVSTPPYSMSRVQVSGSASACAATGRTVIGAPGVIQAPTPIRRASVANDASTAATALDARPLPRNAELMSWRLLSGLWPGRRADLSTPTPRSEARDE
ncbi:hypothetical protein CIK06_27890 [Plantactinospora sp. KBS50]|nr:hypothetical protein CIK06_27890 [Plantactinospora sp. KBS50]